MHTHTYTHTHTHTHQPICHFFPLLVVSQRPWNTFFRNTRTRLKLMTSSSAHNTTLPLTTRQMTSLVLVIHNNCSSNATLCNWPVKGTGTWYEGISHGLVPHVVFVWLPTRSYRWPSWKDRTKDGSYPLISSAEVKEIQTSHPATRVRDNVTGHHTNREGYHPLTPTRHILSGNSGSLYERVGNDKEESLLVMRICFLNAQRKNRYNINLRKQRRSQWHITIGVLIQINPYSRGWTIIHRGIDNALLGQMEPLYYIMCFFLGVF